MVPLCDLQRQYIDLKDEIDDAMQQVAADARYILGPNVQAFEKEMADYCGCKYAVGVGSGTDALHLALRALGIGSGDEVITTPFTFIGTTEAICMVGAAPVFVDIDPHTFNLDARLLDEAITPRTKAILPVHLYGQPCDMDRLVDIANRYELDIVEDCAQAVGATYRGQKVGSFGKAGCFSFFPSKNLGGIGDGGMVLTNDTQVYESVEMLRRHGGKVKYHHSRLGLNSRLDELQAAILRIKFKHLDDWNLSRRRIADRYSRRLSDSSSMVLPQEISSSEQHSDPGISPGTDLVKHVFHQYTILVEDRSAVQKQLTASGIGCAVYYPVPLHLQEVHRSLGYSTGDFPVAEDVSNRCLSIPMFPHLDEQQQSTIANHLESMVAVSA